MTAPGEPDGPWHTAEVRVYDRDGAGNGRTLVHVEGDARSVAAALRSVADRIDPPKPPRPALRGPIADTLAVVNASSPPAGDRVMNGPMVTRSGEAIIVGREGIRRADQAE